MSESNDLLVDFAITGHVQFSFFLGALESIVSKFQQRKFCLIRKLVDGLEEFVFDLRVSAFGNGHTNDLYIFMRILNGGTECAQRTEHTILGTGENLLHIVVNVFKIELVPVLGIVDLHNAAHDIELHCKIERLLCLQNSCTLLGRLTGFFGSNLIFQLGGIKLNVRYCSNFGMLKVSQGGSMNFNITAGTIARTAVLLLALTNQLLSAMGKSPLPIESATVEQLVTAGITTIAALIAWWKNNSFTKEAIAADAEYDRLRKRNGK